MNERLTEIYRSCRPKEALASQDQFKSANVLIGSEIDKFVELIVQECANLFDKDEMELTLTERTIHNTIKQHFGVKE
jgi:hypothetical protein